MEIKQLTSKKVPSVEPNLSSEVIQSGKRLFRRLGMGTGGMSEMNDKIRQPPDTSMKAEKTKRKKGRLTADIQYKLGQQLRAMYTDVVNEGVPDQFSELIQRLDKRDEK